jgi:hypothetical protein
MTDASSVAQQYFDAWNRHDAAGIRTPNLLKNNMAGILLPGI